MRYLLIVITLFCFQASFGSDDLSTSGAEELSALKQALAEIQATVDASDAQLKKALNVQDDPDSVQVPVTEVRQISDAELSSMLISVGSWIKVKRQLSEAGIEVTPEQRRIVREFVADRDQFATDFMKHRTVQRQQVGGHRDDNHFEDTKRIQGLVRKSDGRTFKRANIIHRNARVKVSH